MSDVFIDVGLPKTGTTFRQKVIYPQLDDIEYYRYAFKRGINEFIGYENSKILISDESISGRCCYMPQHSASERYNAVRNLKKLYPDAEILISVRNRDEWIQSLYRQYIWFGGKLTFNEWLEDIDTEAHDIQKYIRLLEENFDTVHIFYLEDMKKNIYTFAEKLCAVLGVEYVEFDNRIVNRSFSVRQTETLRKLNYLNRGTVGEYLYRYIFRRLLRCIRQ